MVSGVDRKLARWRATPPDKTTPPRAPPINAILARLATITSARNWHISWQKASPARAFSIMSCGVRLGGFMPCTSAIATTKASRLPPPQIRSTETFGLLRCRTRLTSCCNGVRGANRLWPPSQAMAMRLSSLPTNRQEPKPVPGPATSIGALGSAVPDFNSMKLSLLTRVTE